MKKQDKFALSQQFSRPCLSKPQEDAKGMNSQKAGKKEPAKTPKEKKEEKREKKKAGYQ